MRKRIKKKKKMVILIFITTTILMLKANYSVKKSAANKTFSDSSVITKNKVGLLLGTSKILKNGRINYYFKYRVDAAVELFKKGEIEFILVSGDNGTETYDEPTEFKNELIKNGIPEHSIFLDYAGFRTLDSVIRSKEVFGQLSITIISQKFHNERAIYLAEKNGISAIGYNARDLSGKYGFKTRFREYFARTKAFLDVMFGVEPKFLGAKIEIQ